MILVENYTSWVDVDSKKLSLCWDFNEVVYGAAAIAPRARNPVLLSILKEATSRVKYHFYGSNWLQITGPVAVQEAIIRGHHLADIHGKCILDNITWNQQHKKVLTITSYPDRSKVLMISDPDVHYQGQHCKICNHYVHLWAQKKVYCDLLQNPAEFPHCKKSENFLIL